MDPALIVLMLLVALTGWLLLPRLRRDHADRLARPRTPAPRPLRAVDDLPSVPAAIRCSSQVTVNGQPVDADTANDVAQWVGRLVGSAHVSTGAGDELRHLLEKARIVGAVSGEDLDTRLRQLKRLHDERLITDTEYAARKADMLSQL